MQKITVLGATGSIGQNTLDVIARHRDKYQVFALTCHQQVEALIQQAIIHQPEYLVITDPDYYSKARELAVQANLSIPILSGEDALIEIVEHKTVDCVMAAIVGAAGLLPTLSAVKAGKKVLLANKESLVMSGSLFMQEVSKSGARLLPIDSEHNAIFQCMPVDYRYGEAKQRGIEKILLTGSGGPFLTTPLTQLESKTPGQACAHPNWNMGRKISVDSATMMNKGLEFIEACWLFGVSPAQIDVVIHPQSVIHSMVQYNDGSVLAQLGNPDMRTPIAHALGYPERIESGVERLDFASMQNFSFQQPDYQRFPNLKLAIDAASQGQYASTALNAVNEVAVEAFLQGRIAFTGIASLNDSILQRTSSRQLGCIDEVIEFDQQIRRQALQSLQGAA